MSDTQNYKPHQRITFQDIEFLMCIHPKTAQKYYTDIKKHFSTPAVTYQHYCRYFNLN